MLRKVDRIIEQYLCGEVDGWGDSLTESIIALPSGWTEEDSISVGIPIAIDSRLNGYVAAIELDSRANPMPWIGTVLHRTSSDALSDAIKQAIQMKSLSSPQRPSST